MIVGTWKEVQPAVGLSEPGVQGRSIGEATGKGPAFSRAAWPDPETLGIILIRDVRRLRQVGGHSEISAWLERKAVRL